MVYMKKRDAVQECIIGRLCWLILDVNIKCELKPGENCNTYKCIDGKEKHFITKFIFVLSIVLDNNGVNSYSYCKFHDVNMGCSQTNISVTINIYSTIYLNKKKSDNVFHIYLAMSCQF